MSDFKLLSTCLFEYKQHQLAHLNIDELRVIHPYVKMLCDKIISLRSTKLLAQPWENNFTLSIDLLGKNSQFYYRARGKPDLCIYDEDYFNSYNRAQQHLKEEEDPEQISFYKKLSFDTIHGSIDCLIELKFPKFGEGNTPEPELTTLLKSSKSQLIAQIAALSKLKN